MAEVELKLEEHMKEVLKARNGLAKIGEALEAVDDPACKERLGCLGTPNCMAIKIIPCDAQVAKGAGQAQGYHGGIREGLRDIVGGPNRRQNNRLCDTVPQLHSSCAHQSAHVCSNPPPAPHLIRLVADLEAHFKSAQKLTLVRKAT